MRTGIFAGSVALALGLLGVSSALAQRCDSQLDLNGTGGPFAGALPIVAAGLSGGLAISSAVTAAQTAFLSQGTAFTASPANPKPDSEGSGIWIRGAGGEMTVNSSSSVSATQTYPTSNSNPTKLSSTGSTTCSTRFQQTFGGFQLGHDVARLNVGGWNLTLGTTAGFLETTGHIVGGALSDRLTPGGPFNSTTQAPFAGSYAVAAYGNFSIDGLVQYDYFQANLDSPSINFHNQKVAAHGFTAAASAGYTWQVPNSTWFIEPRAGVVWSRETVDPLDVKSFTISGTTHTEDIESIIGRAGVRVGTTVETANAVYQPFAAASVWHDFGSRITANYATCPSCAFGGTSEFTASLSTNNVGTFGQYSLGVAGQFKDTGWLGFVRADYREGSDIRGWSGSGGIRYQFTPTAAAGVMPSKEKAPADHPVDWTGVYVGGFGGAELGRSSMTFPASQYSYLGVQHVFPGSKADMRPSGWLGGGTLGYNYQAGRWVLGVEGDFAGTHASGSAPCAPLAPPDNGGEPVTIQAPFFQTTCHDNLNWVATATARLGYAWTPRTLLYVKGGGAWADEELSWTCNLGPGNFSKTGQSCTNLANNLSDGGSVRNMRAGWTVGFGTEFALTDRWSIKGEFDWIDFGTKSSTFSDGTADGLPAFSDRTAINSSLRTAQGKIGVNYKLFGP